MNYTKSIFLSSLSLMMLTFSGMGIFYIWQSNTVKTLNEKLRRERKTANDLAYENSFYNILAAAYASSGSEVTTGNGLSEAMDQIKLEMRQDGYDKSEISRIFTTAFNKLAARISKN